MQSEARRFEGKTQVEKKEQESIQVVKQKDESKDWLLRSHSGRTEKIAELLKELNRRNSLNKKLRIEYE